VRNTLRVTDQLQLVNKAPRVQRYVQLAMSLFKGASRSVVIATTRRAAPICVARRAASSSVESQQKVCSQESFYLMTSLLMRWGFCSCLPRISSRRIQLYIRSYRMYVARYRSRDSFTDIRMDRRKTDKSILSTSSLLRTLLLRLY
jgi:hypothetical protein